MKLKLDENIAVSTAPRLAVLGFDVDTALGEGLGGKSDPEVWAAAQREGRFLVTHDLDFSDVRKFAPGTHHGLLLVRLPDSEQWRVWRPPGRLVLVARSALVGAMLRRGDAEQGESDTTAIFMIGEQEAPMRTHLAPLAPR